MLSLKKVIAIRVDVDTLVGLRKGVPNLLKLFSRHNIKATFFVVMGPDQMGRHAKRFKKKGYAKRILSINPLRLMRKYGLVSFFYGTLLPPPLIGESNPDLLKTIVSQGHELGIHGYDHNKWADFSESLSKEEVAVEFTKAFFAYKRIFGKGPLSSAAPNWRSHERLFCIEDEHNLQYASDLRGYYPFRPSVDGRSFSTLQIPVTLSSTHECLQMGVPKSDVIRHITQGLTDAVNVWTIHDWYEGLCETHFVEEFISLAKDSKYHFATLKEISDDLFRTNSAIPNCAVEKRAVDGGIGEVTWQIKNS